MSAKEGGFRILVVEDNPDDVRLLRESLVDARQEYTVTHEATLDGGLKKLEEQVFDVVLMDLSLPDAAGIDNVRRAYARAPQVPIIVLTGFEDQTLVTKAVRAGAQEYIVKTSVDPAILERCIRHAIERHRFQVALRSSEERYALALRGTSDGIWDWNVAEDTIYFSPRWAEMLGLDPATLTPSSNEWFGRLHPEDADRVKLAVRSQLETPTASFETQYRIAHANGTYRWMLSRAATVQDAGGKVVRMAGAQTDVTEKTVRDPLTGLANKVLLIDRLRRVVGRARRSAEYSFALLNVDLDRFKAVNTGYGQAFADRLLIEVGQRIESCLRLSDTVARPGEDEFIVLVEDVALPDGAIRVAKRIHSVLVFPIRLDGQEVYITGSIGIALSTSKYERPEDVLRDASTAMSRAKALGKGQYQVFDEAMHDKAVEGMRLEGDLRRAIERSEFRLHYQPIVALETRQILGFEALIRWEHPKLGLVYPDKFIPILEDSGLIVAVGEWVLREASTCLRAWQERLPLAKDAYMTVNVSSNQFLDKDVIRKIDRALEASGLEPRHLCLEITERLIVEQTAAVTEILAAIKDRRIRIAIDDFGVGYSALGYLHKFPLDVLKIDRSFTARLDGGSNSIVRTILDLGANLNMQVIAEGVETDEQVQVLQGLRCRYGQGYLFSRPVTPEKIEQLLKSHESNRI